MRAGEIVVAEPVEMSPGQAGGRGVKRKAPTGKRSSCDGCRARRVFCNTGAPCETCVRTERECVYSPKQPRKRASRPAAASTNGSGSTTPAALPLSTPASTQPAPEAAAALDQGSGCLPIVRWSEGPSQWVSKKLSRDLIDQFCSLAGYSAPDPFQNSSTTALLRALDSVDGEVGLLPEGPCRALAFATLAVAATTSGHPALFAGVAGSQTLLPDFPPGVDQRPIGLARRKACMELLETAESAAHAAGIAVTIEPHGLNATTCFMLDFLQFHRTRTEGGTRLWGAAAINQLKVLTPMSDVWTGSFGTVYAATLVTHHVLRPLWVGQPPLLSEEDELDLLGVKLGGRPEVALPPGANLLDVLEFSSQLLASACTVGRFLHTSFLSKRARSADVPVNELARLLDLLSRLHRDVAHVEHALLGLQLRQESVPNSVSDGSGITQVHFGITNLYMLLCLLACRAAALQGAAASHWQVHAKVRWMAQAAVQNFLLVATSDKVPTYTLVHALVVPVHEWAPAALQLDLDAQALLLLSACGKKHGWAWADQAGLVDAVEARWCEKAMALLVSSDNGLAVTQENQFTQHE